MRTDLEMKPGKLASQVAHASMAFLSNKIRQAMTDDSKSIHLEFSEAETIWLRGKFTKIILAASSEEELRSLHRQFEEKSIPAVLIVDDGTTVFDSKPTATCLGVGPAYADEIDIFAGHLKLYK